jgi:hypothetical protein
LAAGPDHIRIIPSGIATPVAGFADVIDASETAVAESADAAFAA